MLIGFGPGGGYDLWGRVVARHIGKHFARQSDGGAAEHAGRRQLRGRQQHLQSGPKDGSVMGIIARDAALGPITGATGARFDPTKITWLGTPTTETNVCIASHNRQGADAQGALQTRN